jgi:hypothetical protein
VSQNRIASTLCGALVLAFAGGLALFGAATGSAQTTGSSTVAKLPATIDTKITQSLPDATYGSSTRLMVDGDEPSGTWRDSSVLIKFNLSGVPAGSKIQSATLKFNVTNPSTQSYGIYNLKKAWVESQATWKQYKSGSSWEVYGANGTTDRGSTELGPFKATSTGVVSVPLNSSGVAQVQQWLDGPTTNNGFIIAGPSNADGLEVSSREGVTPPVLEVTYSPSGSTATNDCNHTLQSKIDATPTGGTVTLAACIYRSKAEVPRPMTIRGQSGTEIRGSDNWSGNFSASSRGYVSSKTVPSFPTDTGRCAVGHPECNWPEQVFVNGVEQKQLPTGSTPGAGQFALDSSRHVVLGSDPRGKLVEVSVRQTWIGALVGNVTFDGITAKHAANPSGSYGALYNRGGQSGNVTVKNSDLSYAHSAIVDFASGTNMNHIQNSRIHHAGSLGISQFGGSLSYTGNYIYNNNTQGFDPNWEAGGVKNFKLSNEQAQNNRVYNNNGWGMWCDYQCVGGDLSYNKIHHNAEGGLFHEYSIGAGPVNIHHNDIWENGWKNSFGAGAGQGILVNNSTNVNIYENIIAWNPQGFKATRSNRSGGTSFSNVKVYNNYIANKDYETLSQDSSQHRMGQANAWYDWVDGSTLYSASSGNGGSNKYYYPTAEISSYGRYKCWTASWTHSISTFNGTRCGGGSSAYLSASAKDSLFTSRGVPIAPEH